MSIVAGFNVKDGVLVCADTQYTGANKIFQKKIFPFYIGTESYVFAFGGNEENAKMAIDECRYAVEEIVASKRTVRSVRSAIRKAVKPVVEWYVLNRPENERQTLEFMLLIACHISGAGNHIFTVGRNGAIIESPGYAFLGTGDYLAQYILGEIFSQHMNIDGLVIFAAQLLRSVKSYDPNCGGKSTFVTIDNKGKHAEISHDFYHLEMFLAGYEGHMKALLFSLGNPNVPERFVDDRLQEFAAAMKQLRHGYITSQTQYRKTLDALPKKAD